MRPLPPLCSLHPSARRCRPGAQCRSTACSSAPRGDRHTRHRNTQPRPSGAASWCELKEEDPRHHRSDAASARRVVAGLPPCFRSVPLERVTCEQASALWGLFHPESKLSATPRAEARRAVRCAEAHQRGLDPASLRFPGATPLLHRCLSTGAHPRVPPRRVRPRRQHSASHFRPKPSRADERRSTPGLFSTDESVVRASVASDPHPILPWALFPFEASRDLPFWFRLPRESSQSLPGLALHRSAWLPESLSG